MTGVEVIKCVSATVIAAHMVFVDGDLVAVAPNPVTADRVAELLERYGMVDVPDTCADLTDGAA